MEERKINEQKLAPEFYVWENDYEEVWATESNPFFVIRNGEMRIIVRRSADDEISELIRYSDLLERFGITTDKELEEWSKKEDVFSVINNPWFEVWSVKDTEFFSEPFFDLKEAIAQAEVMLQEYPTGVVAD